MGQFISSPNTPGGAGGPGEQGSWLHRFGAKALGTIGGVIAMATGVVVCISISATCIVAGIFQILFGFLTVSMEAPCCCMWLDFIDRLSSFSERRPPIQKAIVYVAFGIFPMALCPGLSSIFGSLLILLTGVAYGVLALGKKAPVNQMMASAGGGHTNDGLEQSIVDKDRNPVVPEV